MADSNYSFNNLWIGAVIVLVAILGWVAYQTHFVKDGGVTFLRSRMDIIHADGTVSKFKIEVAATNKQKERGLMFRKDLDDNAGMLFIWPVDQEIDMWMKNTEIPLDMLFLDKAGNIIKIIANAVPEDLTVLSSGVPARAVVEIGGGQTEKQSIKLGDRVVSPAFVPQQ